MNNSLLFNYIPKNLSQAKPCKKTIQYILDYSKAMQVKKTADGKVLFFMNN
ncbi:MAG: hypothetical protein LBH82_01090 [Bacteroidales bacterium]|jgi:hypothetical protein|nr:hypothetical protein [Bacteroidales bacterium]